MIRNDIQKYDECSSCPVAQKALEKLLKHYQSTERVERDIVLTQCSQHYDWFLGTSCQFVCMITDLGRLDRLSLISSSSRFRAGGGIQEIFEPCPHMTKKISKRIIKAFGFK